MEGGDDDNDNSTNAGANSDHKSHVSTNLRLADTGEEHQVPVSVDFELNVKTESNEKEAKKHSFGKI